ncbi:MAG: radical SAM protein [Candidatus Hodarchaeota archaeon]
MESPDHIRLSNAADITLGYSHGRFWRNAKLFCINVLLSFEDGCTANCLYCGQGRETASSAVCKSLIRVEWPLRPLDESIERFRKKFVGSGSFHRPYRFCVSTITHPKAVDAEIEVVGRIHDALRVPVSALISPTIFTRESLKQLKEAGAERVGIAIDCANRDSFDMLRGERARGPHQYDRYLEGVREAVEIFGPGKPGIHLIVGLGETEEEAVTLMQRIDDMDAESHLFSFYPEPESMLLEWARPDISQYRRIQLARYIINNKMATSHEMVFNEHGQIVDFGLSERFLRSISEPGEPFMTSGCPGCNRPFANEKPGEVIRNFPYHLSTSEGKTAFKKALRYKKPKNTLRHLEKYIEEKTRERKEELSLLDS